MRYVGPCRRYARGARPVAAPKGPPGAGKAALTALGCIVYRIGPKAAHEALSSAKGTLALGAMGIGAGKLVDTLLSEPVEAYEDYFRVYFQAPSAEEIAAGLDPFFDEEDDFGPMLFDPEDVGPFSLFGASPDDVPFRRPRDLPGRNDPCWCGSGHKYKHCHWKEDLGDTS